MWKQKMVNMFRVQTVTALHLAFISTDFLQT